MGKSYLVTGAAGFIGSSIARKLIETGNKVVTIDNLSTGYISNIPDGVKFIHGNCQDELVISLLNEYTFDAIYHIAGQSSGEISFDNPIYDLQTNTQSTLLLLKYALKSNCKKFIYASTMSVYGCQHDVLVNEEMSTIPISFYGVGKIASEHYLRIFSQYGIQCTSLRLFNVYGPGQNLNNLKQGMVSIFLAMGIKNNIIEVRGSRDRYRDFVYIDDVVNAFLLSEKRKENDYLVLNICTGVKTRIYELIELILKLIPSQISVYYEGNTPGDQFGIVGNYSKAKEMIKWTPQTNLKEGLRMMYEWASNL